MSVAASPFRFAKTCKVIGPKRITEDLSTICEVDGRRAIVHGVPLLAQILTRKLIACEMVGYALAPLAGVRFPDWSIFTATPDNPIDDGRIRFYSGHVLVSFIVPNAIGINSHAVQPYMAQRRMVSTDLASNLVFHQWILSQHQDGFHTRTSDAPDQLLTYSTFNFVHYPIVKPATHADAHAHLSCYGRMLVLSELATAFQKLRTIPAQAIADIVNALPEGVDMLDDAERPAMARWLFERAQFLAEHGMECLKRSPMWSLVGPFDKARL